MLTTVYHMLKDEILYRDLGPDLFDSRDKQAASLRLVKRLPRHGYDVQLTP